MKHRSVPQGRHRRGRHRQTRKRRPIPAIVASAFLASCWFVLAVGSGAVQAGTEALDPGKIKHGIRPQLHISKAEIRPVLPSIPVWEKAVQVAMSKKGVPYVWGAKGPNVFDCSGLVQWSWRQAGVNLGEDTYAQIKQGKPVPPDQVQPGDLIFPMAEMGSRGPGHVQLAISRTEVIEAPGRGMTVRVIQMPASFVARRVA